MIAPDSYLGSAQAVHTPIVYYPGHMARAERQLKEQISLVDLVLEVRDARVLAASTHPLVSPFTWGIGFGRLCSSRVESEAGGLVG